ncbi:MAG: DUF3084 domain-containing protein, partial [Okeania sp. SIO2D1]|nr:DUF3084 domain-containing protein [Okeania sp. SIO2D1]
MTSAYILIVAVLVLGGVLAALGDRLGTKVGKARLRLFNLRPRQTAVVVTVFTGTVIAASTLVILFTTSKSLRQGIFILDEILRDLRLAKSELADVSQEKATVEEELKYAQRRRVRVQDRLAATQKKFKDTQSQLKNISQQAVNLRKEVGKLLKERQQLSRRRNQLLKERQQLSRERNQL